MVVGEELAAVTVEMTGGVVSNDALLIVTVTPLDVVELPAASLATAVRV
jgi:hypothetical protein